MARNINCTILIALAFLSACKYDTFVDSKPNIIIFFTDDQGYGDLGCYGADKIKTPHIDQLAKEGIRFTDFYSVASVCTPSRAALMTGMYPKQVGLHEAVLFPYSKNGLAPKEITLPELLKPLGYSTGCIGKWHLGHQEEFMPNNQGFDYFYGVPYSNDMDERFYKHNNFQSPPLPLFKNKKQIDQGPDQKHLTKMWTKASVDFINTNSDNPFFLYIPHNMPHLPWHASDQFRDSSEHGLYGDIIQELDWSMGEIQKALKENHIEENTIIVFTSDNGPVTRFKNGGSAGPLRGSKATTWEGGMRVPGIISWPAKISPGKVCLQPVSTMDLLPTFVAIAGGKVSKNIHRHSRDISQILFRPNNIIDADFELLYYGWNGELEAIRSGDWKLHIAKSIGWVKENGKFPISLYNLKDDIGESKNVAGKYPKVVEQLQSTMKLLDDEF